MPASGPFSARKPAPPWPNTRDESVGVTNAVPLAALPGAMRAMRLLVVTQGGIQACVSSQPHSAASSTTCLPTIRVSSTRRRIRHRRRRHSARRPHCRLPLSRRFPPPSALSPMQPSMVPFGAPWCPPPPRCMPPPRRMPPPPSLAPPSAPPSSTPRCRLPRSRSRRCRRCAGRRSHCRRRCSRCRS